MPQQDYNSTLNLPKTDFPMRAGLPRREPEMLRRWQETDLYGQLMKKNESKPLWVLHDGPPYANGDIHIGTAMNKIIKDMIVRYRNMSGWQSPFVPGFDTHGLPIELKARAKVGTKAAARMSAVELRRICRDYALTYVEKQSEEFERLGVLGEWDNPYLTLAPEYEANQIQVFGEMALKGYIYKGLKPVYWCPDCQTALAEAEIEYSEDPVESVYVKFQVTDDREVFRNAGISPDKVYFVIWTTTTWTLPANVAICLGPDFTYQAIQAGDEYYIVAEALAESSMAAAGITDYQAVASFKGSELEYIKVRHPFLNRESLVIVGDHVTLESGTGCVHTAPGHGMEDFEVCKKYPQIPCPVPVDDHGKMTDEAGEAFAGMTTEEAGKAIAECLKESGALFATSRLIHQYPHCWRCKKPVLFRATEQWFCSVDAFKEDTLNQIHSVQWMPSWGEDRISAMVRDRSDWCISRQRLWGVPIPVFYCEDCGKPIIRKDFIDAVSRLFRSEGSDGWYTHTASEIMPEGVVCPHCGGSRLRKESDIMDVWFDSGSSHMAVLKERPYLKWPADLYMEGGDQYRGWFQSSLLTAVAVTGQTPYKAVLTHGWTVDGEGKAMHKSAGNAISPQEIIDQYGADILRLWVASLDYTADAHLSKDILKQLSEAYRKIRNTARFILGNLGDFDPDSDSVPDESLEEIDRWALMKLHGLTHDVLKAYESYAFHEAIHALHNFCVVELSNFYLDILKDRLYVEKAGSLTRRAAQTALYRILNALTRLLCPILAFTSEEIWAALPKKQTEDPKAAILNGMPPENQMLAIDEQLLCRWEKIRKIRDDVLKAMEAARLEKLIGGSLDASVTLFAQGDLASFISETLPTLKMACIVSELSLSRDDSGDFTGETNGLTISVKHAAGNKCQRCWTFDSSVGEDPNHPDLCARCAKIMA